ncbi:MAG: hypothetical protein Kow0042_02180 [Calditrichia bacterium]
MTMRKPAVLKLFFILFIISLLSPLKNPAFAGADFVFQEGEELFYSVKWSFIHLGTLRLQILKADSVNNRKVYHCRIYIDSNPSLPFVNIHDVYDSFIDAENIYSHVFLSYEKKSDHILYTRYDFDYERNEVHIRIEEQRGTNSVVVLDSVASITDKVQDSLSLLFFARAMVKNRIDTTVRVFAFNKFESTLINFTGERKKIKLNSFAIDSYYLDGRLKFVGIAGVKEDFKGWFSPDRQSVPLKANMKAFVGSVKIELEEWKNWEWDSILTDR